MNRNEHPADSTTEAQVTPSSQPIANALGGSSVLRPTMALRWSKMVLYDGTIDANIRVLEQRYIDETNGKDVWLPIPVDV